MNKEESGKRRGEGERRGTETVVKSLDFTQGGEGLKGTREVFHA